jgi:hypothetical protein
MSVAPSSGYNRIMIYGPKPDGTYVVESSRWPTVKRQRYRCRRSDRCPQPGDARFSPREDS